MATRLTLAPLLLLTIVLLTTETTAQPAAPAPGPAGPINLTAILAKGGQFTTFIHLLTITQVGSQVDTQVNSSPEGMTIFAPTDNAFQNLKPGTLNKLSPDEQLKLILYHIVPKFYSMDDFLSVSNPVRTQASGRDNGVYGLNITGQTNQINVSTGYVETRISNSLRDRRPLAIYVIDMVLLPGEMLGEHKLKSIAPAPKSPSSGVSDDSNSNSIKKAAASPSDKSGSDPKRHKHSPIAPAPVPVFAPIPAFAPVPAPKSPSSKVSDDTSNSTQNVAASPSDKSGSGYMKVVLGFGLGLVVLCLTFLF